MTGQAVDQARTRARSFPTELPDSVRSNPLRSAECKVYDRLKHLPAAYTFFYSRPWLGLSADGREVDGEADFVVAHPEHGILTIEVKGGTIIRDALTERWTSIDRHGIPHPIKNPVDQARQSKHQILRKLREAQTGPPRFIRGAHGVVFPDVAEPPGDLGADMPRRLFACREQMSALPQWVEQRMESAADSGGQFTPLGDDGVELLVGLLASSFVLHSPLAGSLGTAERQIITLTEQQYQVLDGLSKCRRCAVAGGAGTGKTLLALEKARRLAAEGRRTLLTCRSRPLAAWLRSAVVGTQRLSVGAFEDIAVLINGSPIADEGVSRPEERLLATLETVATDALFDAVVVDEGQDFLTSWWPALELCLRNAREGHFYVFHDDNQKVYPGATGWPDDLVPYSLTRNLRNSRTICAQSLPFYVGSPMTAAGPEGRMIEWVAAKNQVEMVAAAEVLVARLTGPDEIRVEEIAVLGKRMPGRATLGVDRIAGFPLTPALAPGPGALVAAAIAEFKGLERRVVILLGPEEMIDDPELLYVGLSRARTHLIVVGDAASMSLLQKMARDRSRMR